MKRAKSCTVCGRRTPDGSSRCPLHPPGTGARMRSCIVCGRPSQSNFCPEHEPTEADRLTKQPYRKHYTSAEYRRNKAKRMELSGGKCERCGRELKSGRWHAHHVIELSNGGTDAVENLRALCSFKLPDGRMAGCHAEVHRTR